MEKCESSGLCLQLTPKEGPSHHLLGSFGVITSAIKACNALLEDL